MSVTPAILQAGIAVGLSSTVLYACPGGVKAVVTRPLFVNRGGTPQTLSVNIVRSDNTTAPLIPAVILGPGQAYVSPEISGLVMAAGDQLQATSTDASSIVAVISGILDA